MNCGIKIVENKEIDFGRCESDYPICNDFGRCQLSRIYKYTGINRNYNYKRSLTVIILAFICFMVCAYLFFRITMNLIKGCQDGDMFSCFLLFSGR